MLKQLALLLAVIIVVLLAVVAILTIVNRSSEEEGAEIDSGPTELPGPETTVAVSVGSLGSQVEVGCLLPVPGQSPLLVTFENGTAAADDYQAQLLVSNDDGSTETVMAKASNLQPGERRNVLPQPWIESEQISGCNVVAIQSSDHVILIE